jgi:DNA polymerase-3 subunit beta
VKFTIKKAVLQNALEKASATVSSKDNDPLLKTFNIEVDEDQIRILSTDLSLGSIAKIRVAEIQETGAICVPAQKLLAIVRATEDGDIDFEVAEEEGTRTATRRFHVSIPRQPQRSVGRNSSTLSRRCATLLQLMRPDPC